MFSLKRVVAYVCCLCELWACVCVLSVSLCGCCVYFCMSVYGDVCVALPDYLRLRVFVLCLCVYVCVSVLNVAAGIRKLSASVFGNRKAASSYPNPLPKTLTDTSMDLIYNIKLLCFNFKLLNSMSIQSQFQFQYKCVHIHNTNHSVLMLSIMYVCLNGWMDECRCVSSM
jgi:hypothetical protein